MSDAAPSTTFVFANLESADVTLVIEPWAEVEVVAPGAKVEFTLSGPEVYIESTRLDGDPFVGVFAEEVRMRSDARDMVWPGPAIFSRKQD